MGSPAPQVLAVPLPRRPLLPGGIMPVTVQSNELIKELVELRKQGWVAGLRGVSACERCEHWRRAWHDSRALL